jgi:type II secretory pathway pseudopilin PulG
LPAANSRHSGRAGAARRAGFTIVEVMVAVVVLVIAIVGIVGSMLSAMALNRVNRETAIAQQAARRAIEEVTSVRYRDVYVVFNQEAGDDAASETPERGPSFLVNNLQPQNGDADGMCGRIEFPEIDVGGGNFMLDESFVDAALGMPRELNGNLNPNETLDAGYRVLPLRVWVEWAGVSGNRSIRFETMLSQR